MDVDTRSLGVTATERLLAGFCERSLLKLWTYPNPFKDDGKELCDVLAVFGNHVFIFFDREKLFKEDPDPDADPMIAWERWKSRAVDRQVVTAHGAEKYIRKGRSISLDAKGTIPFPLEIDPVAATIHKIVVAHGAKDACLRSSINNVFGSLAVTYLDTTQPKEQRHAWPFHIEIDRSKPVHLFDSHTLPIVLGELDTITDLSRYLDEKVRAISRYQFLSYCGEEDLLAHYLLNFDEKSGRHVIGGDEKITALMIGEGEWQGFGRSELYSNTKAENEISYFWDELIQRTCQNALEGKLGGNADLFRGQSAIIEMVKEPRFVRRALAGKMRESVLSFPDLPGITRHVSLMPSFYSNVNYVFLQLRVPDDVRRHPDYLDVRRKLLEIACGAAKNKFPSLVKVVGIGMDAPIYAGDTNSEDFLFMPCEAWAEETRLYYEELNEEWRFFGTPNANSYEQTITEFVQPGSAYSRGKTGRNDKCPCGSGRKFKRCHG